MSAIVDSAKNVYASGSTSNPKEPDKADIIRLFALIESVIGSALNGLVVGNSVVYQTRAQLFADLNRPANTLGIVYGDSNAAYNGIYVKAGGSGSGSWTLTSLSVPAIDFGSLAAEIAAARSTSGSLSDRLAAIIADYTAKLASATTPVLDFGQELLLDQNGVVGPVRTIYVPRQIYARIGGATAINTTVGGGSAAFPDHIALSFPASSEIAVVYVDTSDIENPIKIAQQPSGLVQTIAARYFVIAEIWQGVVKSQFPVLRLDENLKSRVQFRYPIVVLSDKILFPAFYHYTRRTGFTLHVPANGDFYWEFDLSTSTTAESRYYFDPVAAASGSAPIKAVTSDTFPTFPRDDRLVSVATSLAGTIKTDHPTVGARPGSRKSSMFMRGNDPDRSTLFSGNTTLVDITNSQLNALGVSRGVSGADAFYGEDLPADTPLEGWYFARCYVQADNIDSYYAPRFYILDAAGNTLVSEGRTSTYFGSAKEKSLSTNSAVFIAFGRYKFSAKPVAFNIGAFQTSGVSNAFAGAQVYLGADFDGYLLPQDWPSPAEMDVLYGPKHFSIAGRPVPFFVPSMLAGERNAFPQPRLTIKRDAANDADTPYFVAGGGSVELDYSRAGSLMLFETQGGAEGAARRSRRTVSNVRTASPKAGAPKVLAFGDSITNRNVLGKLGAKLGSVGMTPTFIGTIQQNDGVMGEGRESWEWQDYYYGDTQFPPATDVSAYLTLQANGVGSDKRQGNNPWVRSATGSDPSAKVFNGRIFDFEWGRQRLGLDVPTHVAINLGTNDINRQTASVSLAQIKTGLSILVPSIRAAGANIQIGIGLPVIPRTGQSDEKWIREQVPAIRAIIDYVKSLGDTRVDVLPLWAHMSADTDWTETALYTVENVTVANVTDQLHPQDANRHMIAEVMAAWIAGTI